MYVFDCCMQNRTVEEELSLRFGSLLKMKVDHCVKELLLNFGHHLQILQHLAPLKKLQMSENRFDIFYLFSK